MNIWLPLIKETKLSPNQLYLLWCIGNKIKPMHINSYSEARALRREECIDEYGNLLPKGLEILGKIPKSRLTPKKVVDLTDDMIQAYLNLFPKGKLPSGKQARADKRNIRVNLEWFFKTYKYDWDTVLKATALYVDQFERNNYLYMKNSQYFISKMNHDRSRECELANYCSQIVTGDFQDDTNHFSEKVV